MSRSLRPVLARAFTLIEALIVVVVIGILSVLTINHLQPGPGARALSLYTSAQKMFDGWTVITDTCGVGRAVGTSHVPATGHDVLAILAQGQRAVAANFQQCYTLTRLKPLGEVIRNNAAGQPAVENYPVSLSGGGTTPFVVTYDEVTQDVAVALTNRFSETPPAALQTSNTTDARVRYQQLADGNYRMQILFDEPGMLAAAGTPTGANTPPTGTNTPPNGGTNTPPGGGTNTPPGGGNHPPPNGGTSTSSSCGTFQGNGNGNGNGNVGSNIGNGNGNGNQAGNNGNCNGNNNSNGTNLGNNNGNNNPTANNGNGNGNNLTNSSNTGNNNGNGSPCGSGTNTSTAGPVSQTNSNVPTSIQMPINIGGNQQATLVNNQNCNQLNQNAVGNTATANGSGTANAGNTAQQSNSSPTSIVQ